MPMIQLSAATSLFVSLPERAIYPTAASRQVAACRLHPAPTATSQELWMLRYVKEYVVQGICRVFGLVAFVHPHGFILPLDTRRQTYISLCGHRDSLWAHEATPTCGNICKGPCSQSRSGS